MSHRDNCPSRWQAEERAREDYDYFRDPCPLPPSEYRECDEARRAYENEWYAAQEAEMARRAEERRAQQRAEEEYFWQQELERQAYDAEYEAWCNAQLEQQYNDYWAAEYHFDTTEIPRWEDDGGAVDN